MTDAPRPEPVLVDPQDLERTAAALCCRFGEPAAEAHRLATLRDFIDTGRMLARELDTFTKQAGVHFHGVHCTAGMRAEVDRLQQALSVWSASVLAASDAYRDWNERDLPRAGSGSRAGRVHYTPMHPALADVFDAPLSSPPA